jgi:hypothetical protein
VQRLHRWLLYEWRRFLCSPQSSAESVGNTQRWVPFFVDPEMCTLIHYIYMFFVCVCNQILSSREERIKTDKGQQQITALLAIVAESPKFPLVEKDFQISKHINNFGKNKNLHRAQNHERLCWRRPAENFCLAPLCNQPSLLRTADMATNVIITQYVRTWAGGVGRRARQNLWVILKGCEGVDSGGCCASGAVFCRPTFSSFQHNSLINFF